MCFAARNRKTDIHFSILNLIVISYLKRFVNVVDLARFQLPLLPPSSCSLTYVPYMPYCMTAV